MAIANHSDLTHIVRTTDQWNNTYDKYELIPTGVLCVELVSSEVTKIKIGDGHNIFSKLPYIGDLDLSKYYTKLETDTRIKEILTQEKVVRIKGVLGSKSDLPAGAKFGDIYFVRQLSSSDNKYIEYIYSPDNTWEPLGGIPIEIDLSEYAKTAYVDDKIDEVNERIDDIEQHGTHTHANKEILDQITEPYTTADKETLASLHNYDDTEIREMISQSSHTHANKDILDATSAAFTKEDKSKLDQLNPYDDSTIKERITELERVAHEHSNKRILDQTTASFTKDYERKMRWIRIYTGCTGMEEGIAGLVPAAQAGEEDYVLSGSGEWVPQTGGGGTYTLPIATASTLGGIKVGDGLTIDANGVLSADGGGSGGDSIAEGDGITITTDPQTGVKTISVNTGDHLSVDSQTGELNVSDVMEEFNIGKGLELVLPTLDTLPAGYGHVDYVKTSGAAYVELNYYVTVNTKVVGTATCDTFNNDAALFGTRQGSGNNEFVMWMQQQSTDPTNMLTGFVYGSNNWSTSTDANGGRTAPYHQGDQYNFEASVAGGLKINNQLLHNVTNYGNPSFTKLCVFACNGYSRGIYNGKMYQFKLYENDTLSAKLIPAVRLSDNAVGFYDVINDIFYTSSASTPFTTDMSTLIIDDPTKVLNAKIGNGLQFDSNNAIEVNTGDGLQINQDGELEIDPSIIPEVIDYEAGNGIEITEVTHEDEFRVQNQEYFFTDHGLTCIITGNYGPRTYTKINDGDIVAAVIGKTGGWYMPLFVGLTEDSVKYSNSYDSNILGPNGSFTYHDKTWYYTADYALTAGDGVDHAGHLQSISDTIYDGAEGSIQAAKDLIDLAVLLPDVSIPTIGAKIGAGLSFDANGAIQADAQPLSPATDSTLGGVIVGNGILVDNDGTISVDPTIIPEVIEYEAGTAISIEDVEHGGVTFDAWDSGTGWENVCYQYSTGNSVVSYQYEAHSPISNSYTLPAGATHIRAIAYDQNDNLLWTSFSWIDSNAYHFASIAPEEGHYSDWFEIPTGAVKVNFGVRHSKLNNTTAMSLNDIKSVDITIQTVREIEVDVWTGVTGWTNGDYYSGTSDTFTTSWPYTYHYNPSEYIPVPEGALKIRVIGISNENDSHFEGGGANIFDSNHHHIGWLPCCTITDEWVDIPEGTVYVQPEVKWNNNNTRTISAADIKSVTLVWKLPALEINQAINVKYGNGLTVNQNNELEVKLGDGLSIDEDGAIEVTGGGGGDSIDEGNGITITTDSQTGIKTIGVNAGTGLDIDPLTNELFVNGQLPEGTIIKKLTYVGNGSGSSNVIKFTKKPVGILSINGSSGTNYISAIPTSINSEYLHGVFGGVNNNGVSCSCKMSYNDTTNELTFTQAAGGNNDAGLIYNANGKTYTMQYLTKGHTGSGTSVNNEVSVVKTFSYVGTGTSTNNIQFPETPDYVLSISGPLGSVGDILAHPIDIEHPTSTSQYMFQWTQSNTSYVGRGTYTFSDSTNVLSLIGADYGGALNYTDNVYYVRYIVNEVIPTTMPYDAGEAISIETIGGLQLTNYSNDDFVDSIANVNAGSIVKAVDKSSFTLTATWDDCYTQGSDLQSNGSYPYNVKASTKYRFAWDSANPDKYGVVYVFENGQYGDMMHAANQHDASYIEFTTSPQTSYIQARFGITYVGNSITYSNVRLYEFIEDEDQYDEISVKYNKGLSVNQNNELEVNIGTGLSFDANGAIQVTGGGGGSGDTVAQGNGINITTDQQTGDKVISVNAGNGLQINQTTHALEATGVTSIAPTSNTPGSITLTNGDGTTTPVSVISQMGGAGASTAGSAGYVPAPASGDNDAYLRGDGVWDDDVLTEDDELTLVFVPDDYQPS